MRMEDLLLTSVLFHADLLQSDSWFIQSLRKSPACRLISWHFHTNSSINVHKSNTNCDNNNSRTNMLCKRGCLVFELLRCGRRQRGWAGQSQSDPIWYRPLHFYLIPHGVFWSSQRADEGICCKCVCGSCEIISGESLSRQTHVHWYFFLFLSHKFIHLPPLGSLMQYIPSILLESGNGLLHSPGSYMPRRPGHWRAPDRWQQRPALAEVGMDTAQQRQQEGTDWNETPAFKKIQFPNLSLFCLPKQRIPDHSHMLLHCLDA